MHRDAPEKILLTEVSLNLVADEIWLYDVLKFDARDNRSVPPRKWVKHRCRRSGGAGSTSSRSIINNS
jgi:hypothetical protein